MSDWSWQEYDDEGRSRESYCSDCDDPIIWLKTKNNKWIAIQPDNVDDPEEIYDKEKHICHWKVCLAKAKGADKEFGDYAP